MRIFLVSYWYEPGLAGFSGPVRVREIARALAALGHDVHLFVPAYREVTSVPGVTMHRVPVVDAAVLRPLSAYLMTALAMARSMRRCRPSLVYFRTMANPLPRLVARGFGVPFVLEVNDDLFQAHARRGRAFHNTLVGLVERSNARGADAVIVHLPEVAEDLITRWRVRPERIVALPGGTDPDVFRPEDAAACRAALGLDVGAPWVGFAGTLYRYQGLATLVDAAPAILSRVPEARFLVVGSGGAEDELRALVEARGLGDRFRFAGWVPYTAVPRYIGAMDVCVMPLTEDRGATLPLKAFDYMACARPIVVSVVPDGQGRWAPFPGVVTVAPGVAAVLADAVCSLLGDAEHRRRLGAANRQAVEERYAWREVARRIAGLGDRCGPRAPGERAPANGAGSCTC